MNRLTDGALDHVAGYFRALAVPARLRLLNALRDGERSVGELTTLTGLSQANVSKHLALLMQAGFVLRAARGTSSYYRIADPETYRLCDTVCGHIGRRFAAQAELQRMFSGQRERTRKPRRTA
jgi:DNA-binding transcriptional ArsR family regulator